MTNAMLPLMHGFHTKLPYSDVALLSSSFSLGLMGSVLADVRKETSQSGTKNKTLKVVILLTENIMTIKSY